MKHLRVCLLLIFAQSGAAFAIPSSDDCIAADQTLVHSWNELYGYYRKYKGYCADGAQAEGLAEVVAELLAVQWGTLPKLHQLTVRHPDFLRWILSRPIMYPEDQEVARRALANLQGNCPPTQAKLCKTLATNVVVD